jgi:hypothetical protein
MLRTWAGLSDPGAGTQREDGAAEIKAGTKRTARRKKHLAVPGRGSSLHNTVTRR